MSEAPPPGRVALLLVDLQEDFLRRPGLTPGRATLEVAARELLDGCRELGVPVVHVHTVVRPDGADRMPHWRDADRWECVEDTPGVRPPTRLAPAAGERVLRKQTFSAFDAPGVETALSGVDTLLVAGVYLHACIRSTALDAYARGHRVHLVEDAIASTEPVHAEVSRDFLERRAARFVGVDEALESAGRKPPPAPSVTDARVPVSFVGGRWRPSRGEARMLRHVRPACLAELVAEVPLAGAREVSEAAAAACAAQSQRADQETRIGWLEAFGRALAAREGALTDAIVREVGKPRAEARAEVRRAGAHVTSAIRVVQETGGDLRLADGVCVRQRPIGVVGLVTPWNNPVAIPVGRIAPALAFGNAAVWKPACQAPTAARLLIDALREAGVPDDLVTLVFGEAQTARCLIAAPEIAAFAVTGSTATGRSAAALCAVHGKRLQAELGGNNAAVVFDDCDVTSTAEGLALAAFGFAGQRCTATRRIVVERSVAPRFRDAFVAATRALRVGDPDDEATQVGPLISARHRRRVVAALELAGAQGGRVLCGGRVPAGLEAGAWLEPAVVAGLPERAHLVQEESFGPVAVLQVADDVHHAIRLVNVVDQGLVAGICTRDPGRRALFLEAAEAGMLNLAGGPLPVHPDAPFAGWKASGIGPPEHGLWDREIFARPQTVYGGDPHA